jgi:hypothetical protein
MPDGSLPFGVYAQCGPRSWSRQGRPGRPAHEPSEDYRTAVRVLRANGVPIATIGRLLGLGKRILTRHYKAELSYGYEDIVAALGSIIVHKALDGDWRAAAWWLSRHGGPEWKQTDVRLQSRMEDAPPMRSRVIILDQNKVTLPRPSIVPEAAAVMGEMVAGS